MLKLKDSIRRRKVKSFNKAICIDNMEEINQTDSAQLRPSLHTSEAADRHISIDRGNQRAYDAAERHISIDRDNQRAYSLLPTRKLINNLLRIDDQKVFRIEEN